jgi:4,5-dihydroxyphthalate decarboxylase
MDIPSTGKVRLRTNLADYPVTMALKEGKISSPVAELDFCGPPVAHNAFKAMLREGKFDCGELAIITYLQAKSYGKPWTLLPYPVNGRFQHHCAGYNVEFGPMDPRDIEGRKVGVRTYAQTTGRWIRGILQHEYGVDLDKVTWMTLDDSHLSEYSDPPNCQRLPKGSDLGQMMLNGELAAALLGNDMPDDPRVRTLVPDPMEAAKAWYEREHVVPINHMFVVHDDVARARPDVVKEIFRMLTESRAANPPKGVYPPIGLEANRKQFEMAIQWSYEQKIIPRMLSVDELFTDLTAGLGA